MLRRVEGYSFMQHWERDEDYAEYEEFRVFAG
jgi:hypothetical protein